MSQTCSARSLQVGEVLPGTAPTALTWVVVEHPGPWGSDALADAALSDLARSALLGLKAAGAGVLLARPARPFAPGLGRSGSASAAGGHQVLLARTAPGGAVQRRIRVDDIADLASWDAAAIAHGHLATVGAADPARVILVCTQGRRDPCCAVEGRALLSALLDEMARRPEPSGHVELWESSHIGGHRLAPVTLTLPSGAVHGRLPVLRAADLIEAAARDEVLVEHLRGRTALPAPLQAADVALRQSIAEPAAAAIDVLVMTSERAVATGHDWRPSTTVVDVEVRHADGRAWRTQVRREDTGANRPESCSKEPVPLLHWVVDDLVPTRHWN